MTAGIYAQPILAALGAWLQLGVAPEARFFWAMPFVFAGLGLVLRRRDVAALGFDVAVASSGTAETVPPTMASCRTSSPICGPTATPAVSTASSIGTAM